MFAAMWNKFKAPVRQISPHTEIDSIDILTHAARLLKKTKSTTAACTKSSFFQPLSLGINYRERWGHWLPTSATLQPRLFLKQWGHWTKPVGSAMIFQAIETQESAKELDELNKQLIEIMLEEKIGSKRSLFSVIFSAIFLRCSKQKSPRLYDLIYNLKTSLMDNNTKDLNDVVTQIKTSLSNTSITLDQLLNCLFLQLSAIDVNILAKKMGMVDYVIGSLPPS